MIISLFLPILLMVIVSTVFWLQLDSTEVEFFYKLFEKYIVLALVGILLVIASLGALLNWLITNLIVPLNKLAEETILMTTVNLNHRIKDRGSREIKTLANVMNGVAKRMQDINSGIDERVAKAKIRLEDEKNTLASLISGLADGIVVCNIDGQIILYNKSAKSIFSGDSDSSAIGLGRSLFGLINKDLIVHSLEDINHRLDNDSPSVISKVVIRTEAKKLLRTHIVPILKHSGSMIGFIIIANDVTKQVEVDIIRDGLFQSLVEQTRSSIAVIRTAIELIFQYPDMAISQRNKFRETILNETISMTDNLDKNISGTYSHFKANWLFEDMSAKDFLALVKRRTLDKLDMAIETEIDCGDKWLKIDTHSFIQSILFLLGHLRSSFATDVITCRVIDKGQFIAIDLLWAGKAIGVNTLNSWAEENVLINESLTFREVMKRHDAELWSSSLSDDNVYYLINFTLANGDGFYNYFNGLPVNCPITDDFKHDLGDVNESMLKEALYYIDNGSC
jgi:DNA polymerase-3 subunit epsilon